jgi:RNA polymerase sigma-70 factor (ECF subfamily)
LDVSDTTVDNTAADAGDDAQLLGLLAKGDRAALTALVRRHQTRVLDIAYRTTGDRALSEDIGQETFLRVWRSAARFQPTGQFSTWLYRIVVNLCLDAFKKRKAVIGNLPDRAGPESQEPPTSLEHGDRAAAVRAAVAGLPDRQRVAVVLHRFSGLRQRAIAEATGWTESAVESLLVRAYTGLRESLKDLEKP